MKKIYFILFVFMGLSISAQNLEKQPKAAKNILEYQQVTQIKPSQNKSVIYSNTFSDPESDWEIAHDETACSLDWQVGTGLACTGSYPIATIVSSTVDDGYALVDSDAYGGASGGSEVENSWLTMKNPVDLNSYPNVVVEFETYYRRYNSEQPYIVVGIGDGNGNVTWPELFPDSDISALTNVFYPFPNWPNSEATTNPQVMQVNISPALVGLTTDQLADIYIRFQWTGTWGYAWFVDDFKILEQANDEIVAQSAWIFEENSGGAEYGRTPLSQAGSNFEIGGSIFNFGVADQNNVKLDATFSGPVSISVADSVEMLENDSTHTFQIMDTIELAIGTYEGVYTYSSVEDSLSVENNILQRNFEITSNVYSLDGIGVHTEEDLGSMGTYSFTDETDGFVCATMYPFRNRDTINSITAYLSSQTVALAEVIVHIIDTAAFKSGDFGNALSTSDRYIVTENDISNGYIEIPVMGSPWGNPPAWGEGEGTSSLAVEPGAYFAALEMYSGGNTYDIGVLDDKKVGQPGWESSIWHTGDATAYTNGNAFAIRLNLGNVASTVGLDDQNEVISIYPNPSSGIVNINFENNNQKTLTVTDISGKVVISEILNSNTSVDLTSFGKGIYIFDLQSEKGNILKKVTIK
jgi:hypothetical protein